MFPLSFIIKLFFVIIITKDSYLYSIAYNFELIVDELSNVSNNNLSLQRAANISQSTPPFSIPTSKNRTYSSGIMKKPKYQLKKPLQIPAPAYQVFNQKIPKYKNRTSSKVKFYLYTKSSINKPFRLFPYNEANFKNSRLNLKHPTKIIIPGKIAKYNWPPIQFLKNSLLNFKVFRNVVIVDYRAFGTYTNYTAASRLARGGPLDDPIVSLILFFTQKGLDVTKMHLFGHSFANGILSLVGKKIKQLTGMLIGRITGLDLSIYYPFITLLESGDGAFVDIIHTNFGGSFGGNYTNLGDANFFPNGFIKIQPGSAKNDNQTENALSSHIRSIYLYAESVSRPKAFQAVRCNSYAKFKKSLCNQNQKVFMGEKCIHTAKGPYFLNTNSKSPYGKGPIKSYIKT